MVKCRTNVFIVLMCCRKIIAKQRCLCVCGLGDHHKGSWGDLRSGSGGVGLGLHPAHCGGGQSPSRRSSWAQRRAQHWWPHHVCQQHQPGGSANHHLPEHHPGKKERLGAESIVVIIKIQWFSFLVAVIEFLDEASVECSELLSLYI